MVAPHTDIDEISMRSFKDHSGSSKAGEPEYLGQDLKNPKGPGYVNEDEIPGYDTEMGSVGDMGEVRPVEDAKDLVTKVIHVEDDPTMNPW